MEFLLSFSLAMILIRRQIVQSLMGPDVIIDGGPLFKLPVVVLQVQVDIIDFIELLPMRPVRPFHSSVQFGRARRKLKKENPFLPAGLLELVPELRTAIDLDGPDREGKFLTQIMEEVRPRGARLSLIGAQAIHPRDRVPGTELETDLVRQQPHLKGIHLDQIPRRLHSIIFGLSDRIPWLAPPLASQLRLPDILRLYQNPSSSKPLHLSPHCRARDLSPFLPQKNRQLLLPPARILLPKLHRIRSTTFGGVWGLRSCRGRLLADSKLVSTFVEEIRFLSTSGK